MADDLLKVHHITSDPNTGETKLVRTTPYLVLKGGAAVRPLFLKGGRVYDAAGVLQDPIPAWVWQEAIMSEPRALREVGFDPDEIRKRADPSAEPIPKPAKHWKDKNGNPVVAKPEGALPNG